MSEEVIYLYPDMFNHRIDEVKDVIEKYHKVIVVKEINVPLKKR